MNTSHSNSSRQFAARLLALALAIGQGVAAAETPNVFWEPYAFDAATLGLFHCNANAAPGAEAEAADLLGNDTMAPTPDAETPARNVLKNEVPMGAGAALTGAATCR